MHPTFCIALKYVLLSTLFFPARKISCLPQQKWNGLYFERTTLQHLGLQVQLGHPSTHQCPLPDRASKSNFVIIAADGIHHVNLNYCGCQLSLPKHVQLLRARLFPSTVTDPRTAATFNVLETFQMLNFTSKISTFEYYQSLARRTDNTGVVSLPVRLSCQLYTSLQRLT